MKRNWATLQRILPYLRPYWKLAILALVLTLLAALFSLLLPWPLAIMFDTVLGGSARCPGPWSLYLAPWTTIVLLVLLAVSTVVLSACKVSSDCSNSTFHQGRPAHDLRVSK